MTNPRWRVLLVLVVLAVPGVVRGDEPGPGASGSARSAGTGLSAPPVGVARLTALSAGRPTVFVTDVNGLERTCQLLAVEAEGLRVAVRAGELVLPWTEVAVVRRTGDPVWDGLLKGAALGGGLNLLLVVGTGESFGDGMSRASWVGRAAVSWGLIGALIDAMHVGRTTVFVAPSRATVRFEAARASRGVVVGARIAF